LAFALAMLPSYSTPLEGGIGALSALRKASSAPRKSDAFGYPCYLPNLSITRGQISKLVDNTGGYPLITPNTLQDFHDVTPGSVFYTSIETAYHSGLVSGYPCGRPPSGS